MRTNIPTMDRDEGVYQLSLIWSQVISTPNQREGSGGLDTVTRGARVRHKFKTPSEAYLGLLAPVTFLVLIKMAVIHRNCQHHLL